MSTEITRFAGKCAFVMCCDFCAKQQDEVAVLIASASGKHICDECIDLCGEIVAEKRLDKERSK